MFLLLFVRCIFSLFFFLFFCFVIQPPVAEEVIDIKGNNDAVLLPASSSTKLSEETQKCRFIYLFFIFLEILKFNSFGFREVS